MAGILPSCQSEDAFFPHLSQDDATGPSGRTSPGRVGFGGTPNGGGLPSRSVTLCQVLGVSGWTWGSEGKEPLGVKEVLVYEALCVNVSRARVGTLFAVKMFDWSLA